MSFMNIKAIERAFDRPSVFFTIHGQTVQNPVSVSVLFKLSNILKGENPEVEVLILDSEEEIQNLFQSGVSPLSAVVIFDKPGGTKHFNFLAQGRHEDSSKFPTWACGAQWGTAVFKNCRIRNCAEQNRAHFIRRFENQMIHNQYPWGKPKLGESGPVKITLSPEMSKIMEHLNSGPNFAKSMANTAHAAELPLGSKISWYRVPDQPIECDTKTVSQWLEAFLQFEIASYNLVMAKGHEISPLLMAGVNVPSGMEHYYLYPPNNHFSVARPDLHYTGNGVFASENDEMPGGFPDTVHIDNAYGINNERWEKAFQWLTKDGLLLFTVSSDWSSCYHEEMNWLTKFLQKKGYKASIVFTDNMTDLALGKEVRFCGEKVGTIWRQWPIFETEGKLAGLVRAAKDGIVRIVPEFSHFGNKTWFSIFRSHENDFRRLLSPEDFKTMEELLPASHIVTGEESFPITVVGQTIQSLPDLMTLPPKIRDQLVLKVAGANDLSARSYGVLMGHGLDQTTWAVWIKDRFRLEQPFIVQRRVETGIARIPVLNTKFDHPEAFACRVLIRPFRINGELVSASVCAVPTNTLRIHGRVDMAMGPVKWV